jgi:hypothetical protein
MGRKYESERGWNWEKEGDNREKREERKKRKRERESAKSGRVRGGKWREKDRERGWERVSGTLVPFGWLGEDDVIFS